MTSPPTYAEFFSGGGMARLAIGDAMACAFANDFDPAKAISYRANFDGAPELRVADIATLTPADIPDQPALIWGSPPCVDISLAGR